MSGEPKVHWLHSSELAFTCYLSPMREPWQIRTEAVRERLVQTYRELHRHPELAFQEVRTAQIIVAELEHLGLPYEYGGKGGAVVARLECGDPKAPTVALRADMDALPVQEQTKLPFASEHPGRMHACGHDAHMAMVLGAAHLLSAEPPDGNVRFVFQPAEEEGGGAQVVLRSGALEGVRAIFGAHVTHHHHTGQVMVREGTITAQSDPFTIRVRGRGGHGARPHEATDAVIIVGLLVVTLQTLVSRYANPLHPSVVTIGRIQGGTAPNVIADNGILEGTIRNTDPDVREQILKGMRRMVRGMAALHEAEIELNLMEGYPAVVNSKNETVLARAAARKVVGERGLVRDEFPSMGAEDFAYYLREMSGCYVRVGARRDDQEVIALHSSRFTIDEESLRVGTAFFEQLVRDALAHYRAKG